MSAREVLKMLGVRTPALLNASCVGAVLAAAFLASSCAPGTARVGLPGSVARTKGVTLRVQVNEGGALVVREVPIEEYVKGTVLSEVHPESSEEFVAGRMFEVQAILARSYAVANRGRHAADGYDLCSTTHCQLYEPGRLATSRWATVAGTATQTTAGEVLWFADAPARVLFHADCGGHTSSAGAVWGGLAPAYLAGSRDGGAAEHAHAEWTFESRAETLRMALNADPRTAVGAALDAIEIAGRDAAGRAEKIVLRGTRTFVVRGEVFREVVTRGLGVKTIRSTLFSVTNSRGTFAFSGRGFGHGVGLCQAGALARLKAGESPVQVLSHYFPGTSLHR